LATFHSFVNATYSYISVDCNDFVELLEII